MDAWEPIPIQSIILALQMIGIDIYSSNYHKAGQLSLERQDGGYGFPVPYNTRDLLEGDDKESLLNHVKGVAHLHPRPLAFSDFIPIWCR